MLVKQHMRYNNRSLSSLFRMWNDNASWGRYLLGIDCPFELPTFADLPRMHELLIAWDSWRGDDVIPLRSEVKLFDIDNFLSHTMLFDMEVPDRIHCRYVGSVFHEIYGHDFTDQNYLDVTASRHRSIRAQRLFSAANQPCIAVWAAEGEQKHGGLPSSTGASLPVRPTDPDKPMQLMHVVVQLGEIAFSELAHREKRDNVKLSDRFSLVDIGAGVPEVL